MGFMNGLLMGIGAAGTTYGENRIHDQREAMRKQAEMEKEKRIEEASIRAEGRAVAGKKAERESELAFNTDPEHVAAVANAKLAGQKVTDAYDDSRFPTKLEQEGKLAHAKHIDPVESPSLAAYHYAQVEALKNKSNNLDENGWSKSDTGILRANNSLEDTFSKQIKTYDDAIENATNEEEKIALQAKRAETENRLNKVIASTQSLVDKYVQPSGNQPQTEESYVDKSDLSGLKTKMAFDTIKEMTKDGSIEPPAVQDMSLSDMLKWISENRKDGRIKEPTKDDKVDNPSTPTTGMLKKYIDTISDKLTPSTPEQQVIDRRGRLNTLTNIADAISGKLTPSQQKWYDSLSNEAKDEFDSLPRRDKIAALHDK